MGSGGGGWVVSGSGKGVQNLMGLVQWGGGGRGRVPGHAHKKKTFHDTLKQELCTVQLNNIIIST